MMLLKVTLEPEEKCLVSLQLVMMWLTRVHGKIPFLCINRGEGVNVGKREDGGETGRSQGRETLVRM